MSYASCTINLYPFCVGALLNNEKSELKTQPFCLVSWYCGVFSDDANMGNHHQEKLPFAARAEGRSNTGSLWLPLRGNGRAQVNPEKWWHQRFLFVPWNRPNPKILSQAVSLACCVCFRSQRQLRYYRLQRVKVSIKRKQGWDYISVVWCLPGNHMAQNQNPKPTACQPKKPAKTKESDS